MRLKLAVILILIAPSVYAEELTFCGPYVYEAPSTTQMCLDIEEQYQVDIECGENRQKLSDLIDKLSITQSQLRLATRRITVLRRKLKANSY